jgi:hypothetical protein
MAAYVTLGIGNGEYFSIHSSGAGAANAGIKGQVQEERVLFMTANSTASLPSAIKYRLGVVSAVLRRSAGGAAACPPSLRIEIIVSATWNPYFFEAALSGGTSRVHGASSRSRR